MYEDVTKHRRTEAALREHARLRRRLLESSPDCAKVLSLGGDLLWMNRAGQQMLGISDFRRFRGTDWVRLWPGPTQPQVRAALAAARFWDVMVTPVPDAQGRPKQLLCTSRDLTPLQRAQDEALRHAEEVTQILNSIDEAFLAIDEHWCLTDLNPWAETLLGRSGASLLGQNIWEAFPEAAETEFFEQYHAARREGRATQFEAFFGPMDTWFKVKTYPHKRGLAVFFQDINAEKREEQAHQERRIILEMILAGPARTSWSAPPG